MRIRLALVQDAKGIRDVYAPIVRDSHTSFELEAPSVEEMAARMNKPPLLPWLVCEGAGGSIAGYAYAGRFRERFAYRWTAETSVYIHPQATGRGLGRALYTALHGMLRLMNYRRAVAGIALPNAASIALHEKMGYQVVGTFHAVGFKLGRWHDVAWYELGLVNAPLRCSGALISAEQLTPSTDDPAPLLELSSVRQEAACLALLNSAALLIKPPAA